MKEARKSSIIFSFNQRGFNPRRLRDYRHVYQVYPIFGEEICRYLQNNRVLSAYSDTPPIWLFLTAKLQLPDNQENVIWQAVIAKLQVVDSQYVEKWRMKSAKLKEWSTPPDRLFNCVFKGMT